MHHQIRTVCNKSVLSSQCVNTHDIGCRSVLCLAAHCRNANRGRQVSLFPLVDLAKQQREDALRQAGLVADQLRQLLIASLRTARKQNSQVATVLAGVEQPCRYKMHGMQA